LLAGDEVLMDSDIAGAMQRYRAESQGSIMVPDHDHALGPGSLDGSGGLVQDQPVGGVHSHEVVGLEVGVARQQLEREGVAHERQSFAGHGRQQGQSGGRTSVWAGT
jgi:hypothetical protein